jgi:CMP/dCMP kinase
MIITISGKAGSGKSTVAKELAKKLNLKHYSIGDLMRQLAKEKKISLSKLSKLAEKDDSIDLELDKKTIDLRENDNFVIDGRLTAYFLPFSNLKVFLDCNDKVRAERILKDNREDEKSKNSRELVKKIKNREQSERKRYTKLYSIDYYDKKLYDLMIDTTSLSIEEVLEEIKSSID